MLALSKSKGPVSQLVNAKETQWDDEIFIAFSPHESKPRCIFESFCAKTEINPTIMRRRWLSTVIHSVHEHISVLHGKLP